MASNKDIQNSYFSTSQLAQLVGISRIAIFKKIQSGEIAAEKVGRNYLIPKTELEVILGKIVPEEKKKRIEAAVGKATHDFEQTLRKLGEE
jgi:excisionase family DNA binding protein